MNQLKHQAQKELRTYDLGISSKWDPFIDKPVEDKSLMDQLMSIKNNMVLGSRITYLEFRGKIISIIRHFNLPPDQSIHLLNCLDRYIPDCCECNECKIRSWIMEERQIRDGR